MARLEAALPCDGAWQAPLRLGEEYAKNVILSLAILRLFDQDGSRVRELKLGREPVIYLNKLSSMTSKGQEMADDGECLSLLRIRIATERSENGTR